jgi:hypothetical protein
MRSDRQVGMRATEDNNFVGRRWWPTTALRRAEKKSASAVWRACGAVIDKHKMKKHFALDIGSPRASAITGDLKARGDMIPTLFRAYSGGWGTDMKISRTMFGAILLTGWAHAAEPADRLASATAVPLPNPRKSSERPPKKSGVQMPLQFF